MNNLFHLRRCPLVMVALVLLVCLTAVPALAAPMRVAILPFEVNAENDLTYLQQGIQDMLSSRLTWQDKVEVINKAEVQSALDTAGGFEGESRALLIGGKLRADYVLFGSLTVFGDSVSIDSRMVDVSGQRQPLPFFVQTRSVGEVIPQINQFATDINQTVFGRAISRPAVAAAPQPGAAPASPGQAASQPYDPRMHPEKLMQSGIQEDYQGAVVGQGATPNPAFVATGAGIGAGRNVGGFWKSRSFKELITGIAVADVDSDDRNELVVVTEKQVTLHEMQSGQLIQTAEITKTRTSTYISVDVADINGNGTPEIYVTSLGPTRTILNSFVLEFSDGNYKTLLDDQPWYYRVVDPVIGPPLLLGQLQRAAEESVFKGEVYEMNWEGGRLAPGVQVIKGGKANVLGLTVADITDAGDRSVVAYTDWDRLRLYNGVTGEMMWEDGDRSGGNTAYFELPPIERGEPNYQYFPLRVRTTDINSDGNPEILIARHDELARNMLKDFRSFSKARIESLAWDGLGLVPVWKTRTFSGRASDFTVGDFDNDGGDELVIAVVTKEGTIAFTSAKSSLIAFDLNPQ
ncbi:MAG: VCBS repeat-containing protein [Desulfobacteraceae bacterium]|nr:VCBS repeat-containing protein [Desulfobacteraceae bacterium]